MESLLLVFFLIYPLFLVRTGSLRPGPVHIAARSGFEEKRIPRREAPCNVRQQTVGETARINRAA
jgi:hypothetical protein